MVTKKRILRLADKLEEMAEKHERAAKARYDNGEYEKAAWENGAAFGLFKAAKKTLERLTDMGASLR